MSTIGYIPGLIPDTNKEVIIICSIHTDDILNINDKQITNKQKATYYTKTIENVIAIISNKIKLFDTAINPYDNQCPQFKLFNKNDFLYPVCFYIDVELAKDQHKRYKNFKQICYDIYGNKIG